MGGTHLAAFREAFVETLRNHFKKDYDAADVRQSIDAAIVVRVQEPVFESQTKTKLGSTDMGPKGPTLKEFVGKFVQQALDTYLHKNRETAEIIKAKIEENEHERKELAGIRNIARERAKKASLHNRKLRDCRLHLGDRNPRAEESTLFIVEGDSAAGSLTATRDVQTQAVFALKGKPLNTYGLTKKVIYENEEFHLLQAALNIEDGLDGLRYNRIVIATDADVDGMHIRLLLLSFFLQFFPDVIRNNHLFILQTPLFRVRNKKITRYCYSEQEKAGGRRRVRRDPRDHALQGPRRDQRRRVQGLHRREHPPRPGEPPPPLQLRRAPELLHGQEHSRKTGLHHRQPPGGERPRRSLIQFIYHHRIHGTHRSRTNPFTGAN
jgi:topoisomerase-4 subunit B